MPREAIGRLIEINLRAPIALTRLVLRRMLLQAGPARVVNVTSLCGVRGFAGLTVYSATKGALDAFTRSLAREVAGREILVNAVAPGFFASEMSDVLAADQVETIRRRTPTGRLVTEEDITPTITRLLFDECNSSGQTIHIDGGYTS
jgi:3-oxoacyl-[acyl-carrier protein] reductase